ncbi:cytochrome P460 family protein [Caulobacter sp. BK020]|uniref:cytochrome P460 family protein n=1 Tax=Caulobacter sp. BK020 TaxID=2512117 RepID=UPI00104BAFBE|nr:cytochrome P460 family protein [Caulobacter sp. BK020]TCS17493.1 cytochrome P460 [Caulobacter sp. BK020]
MFSSSTLAVGGVAAMAVGLCWACAPTKAPSAASPIYGVTVPDGYRDWTLVAPAQEAAPLDELRAVVGNRKALKAYRAAARSFPDGTVLVKLAWKHTSSPDFPPASIPGAATTIQVMVKDSRRYAATGGWGFGRFVNGQPVDKAQHETCFACHAARVKDRDYVFTRYAP